MSQNFSSTSPLQPLSIGNVVSAGLRLYRSHLKSYFGLALKASLWVLIPVYGWAKFYAVSALIARLAFGELVNQPESVAAGSHHVNSKLWQFLVAALLIVLIGVSVWAGFFIVSLIFIGGFAGLVGAISGENTVLVLLATLIGLVVTVGFILGVLWLLSRLFIFELPLAIEDNVDAAATLSRSWELTKGHFWRILAISLVALLITLPLQIAIQVVSSIMQLVLANSILEDDSGVSLLLALLFLGLLLLSNAVVLPFWQAIKAVVYYDLRTRREGLGLKLRDRQI